MVCGRQVRQHTVNVPYVGSNPTRPASFKRKKMKKDFIVYDPVAGLTILQALENAINLAKKTDKIVKSNINDVEMTFSKNTKVAESLKIFHRRLNELYLKQDNSRQK